MADTSSKAAYTNPSEISNTNGANDTPALSETASKPVRCLVVDSAPLIANQPTISTLLSQADQIYTIPSVISEIKDSATRSRLDIQLLPFLKLRSPRSESIKFIQDFARKTGDLEVLSRPDIHLLALCYELDVERTGGHKIRQSPVQAKPAVSTNARPSQNNTPKDDEHRLQGEDAIPISILEGPASTEISVPGDGGLEGSETHAVVDVPAPATVESGLSALSIQEDRTPTPRDPPQQESAPVEELNSDDETSDGWITPSNLKRHQHKDGLVAAPSTTIQTPLDAAILTNDFAMQNVALRIGLDLLSSSTLLRITKVKTWLLRCHGCFTTTRQLDKQFCPRCGQPTLTRTSCSTDAKGVMRLHLKKNYTYNKRGNVFSIPKPTHGTANGKLAVGQGGGKQGWGRDLILAEDQKEYTRKADEQRRTKFRDIMDEDYLPGILTGDRRGGQDRIKVGAGRSVNSKKRR